MLPDKVLKVWRRYLASFFSYVEYSGGGVILTPPSGARVKAHLRLLQAVVARVEEGREVPELAALGLRISGNNGL